MADTWVMPTHIVACAGVVLNEKDEVLMVKTHNAGWVFPGGQVEVGENLFDAVKREIWEESGIEVEVGEVFCVASNTEAFLEYNGRPTYMEYVTRPTFEMKVKRHI